MWPALAPIKARPREGSSLGSQGDDVDPKLCEPALAAPGRLEGVISQLDQLACGERIGDLDRQDSCEVVVAEARVRQRVRSAHGCKRAGLMPRRDPLQSLDCLRDLVSRETVEATASLRVHLENLGVEQPAEVKARGGARDACTGRQLACAQRPPAHELEQHRGTAVIADQLGDAGDVALALHSRIVAPAQFDGDRILMHVRSLGPQPNRD